MRAEVERLQGELSAARETIDRTNGEKRAQTDALTQLTSKLTSLEGQTKALQEAVADARREKERVKAKVSEMEEGMRREVHVVVETARVSNAQGHGNPSSF